MIRREKPRVYEMTPHVDKIVEAILFVIEEAEHRGDAVTQHDISTVIFFADRSHLNRYGRPITFDNYVAMETGPTPVTAFEILDENENALRRLGVLPLWSKVPAPELGRGNFVYRKPERRATNDVLSESDMEELSSALTFIKSRSVWEIRRLTLEDRAYLSAWEGGGGKRQYPISYALFFDPPNHQKAAELSFYSEYV